jgi:hypothetical protein
MKSLSLVFALSLVAATVSSAKVVTVKDKSHLSFIENKGQIRDQNGNDRTDIQYVVQSSGINIFLGNGQLHYQFYKADVKNWNQPGTYIKPQFRKDPNVDRYEEPIEATISTYRLDVELVGANRKAICIPGEGQDYYENYYTTGAPVEGYRAHSFNRITYKNVYPDIDWVIYVKGGNLEHEFIVGKKGDASMINIRYHGQTSLSVTAEGNIVATTPLGSITEKAPVCYNAAGEIQQSAYRVKGNLLTYDIMGAKTDILIDPELIWGTYYGPDVSTSPIYDNAVYDSASLYGCGLTWSGVAGTIATSGAYQTVFGGGTDAFLVKFDTGGHRQWATYYGGAGADWATSVDVDANGQVYMCGVTSSNADIATAGAQQTTYGGNPYDAFVVKFDPDGVRKWATYAGGPGSNYPWTISATSSGKVYLAGDSNESTNIATSTGVHPSKSGGFDWYIIEYDTLGAREWGTYYGGSANEFSGAAYGSPYAVYLTGWTTSTTGISSSFGHQTTIGGDADAVVVKIFENGIFSWGTYYGGAGAEVVGSVTCDQFGYIYLYGHTDSDDGISVPGAFQETRAGGSDAFLVKFHPEIGFRMWGTYFGGPLDESTDHSRIAYDDSGNVYVDGVTVSTSGVATDTAWQTVYGGGENDGFLAKFSGIGIPKWCTYYGGDGGDQPKGLAYFGESVFVSGQTFSTDNIATPGAFQPTGGGSASYVQGIMARFADPDTSSIPVDTVTPPPPPTIVKGTMGNDFHINVYPNPSNGTFSLAAVLGNRNGIVDITITDVSGRVVLSDKAALHNGILREQISMSAAVPAGVYFLRVTTPGIDKVVTFRKE